MKSCSLFFIVATAIAFLTFTPQPVRADEWDAALDMVSSLLDTIFNLTANLISTGGDVISTVIAQAVKQGIALIGRMVVPGSGVVHASFAGVNKILTSVANGVSAIINASVKVISDGISKVIDAGSGSIGDILDRMSGNLKTISTILTDVVNPLTTIQAVQNGPFDSILASFRLALVGILNTVHEPLCQIKNNQSFGPASDVASLVLGELGNTIKSLELSSCSLPACRSLSVAVNKTFVEAQC